MTAGGLNSGPSGLPFLLSPRFSFLASQPWMVTVFAACAQTGRLVHTTGLSHGGHPRPWGWGTETLAHINPRRPALSFPIERIFSEFPVLPFVNILIPLKLTCIPCHGISRTDGRTGECIQCWGISEGCSANSWAQGQMKSSSPAFYFVWPWGTSFTSFVKWGD